MALLLTVAGSVHPVLAQVDPRTRAREVLPAEAFQQLEALTREAEEEGIPVAPLFEKALEGMAKGVPPERILPAVSVQVDRLRTVRTVFGGETDVAVVVAGADALVKGVPAASLQELGRAERTPMALLVLADLVVEGVPADVAVAVVREALARQTGEQDLLAIPSTVRRLLRDGRTPRAAVDAVRRALRDGRDVHRIPGVGRDGGGTGPPAPPGSDPVRRDVRSGGAGGGG